MIQYETVKELIAELENQEGKRRVFVKLNDYHYGVNEIYVDNEGDVILEVEE